MTAPRPLVELVRSGLTESIHFGSAVIVDASGAVLHTVGDAHGPMYPRSANKPAQAVGMLRAGLDLPDDADLALAAASHSGEPEHVRRVRAMLERHGLTEQALLCPLDWPLSERAREDLLASGQQRQRVTMNCSGKHAAMLATCVRRGWSTDDYLDPKHPLQLSLQESVVSLSGEPIAVTSVDGCGAPLFGMSLTGLARTFSRMATAEPGTDSRRVADAMRAHPWLVSGTEREDVRLMRAVPGLLSKVGFEGVLAVALPDGRAVAVKISDGTNRARVPVVVAALRTLGVQSEDLAALAEEPVFGGDQLVGAVRVVDGVF